MDASMARASTTPGAAERATAARERGFGGALVAVALLLTITTMGRASVGLDAGLVVAFALWVRGGWRDDAAAVLPVYLLGVATLCLHFGEEYLTGFQREFPALFGYTWSDGRFMTFNVVWLALFVVAAAGVLRGMRVAYLALLFFALVGGVANGILHLVLCLVFGRYFPGAVTAPALLVLGGLLGRRLFQSSQAELVAEPAAR